jgi:hypothetical protein
MGSLLAILQAATALAPVLESAIPTIKAAFGGAPLTAAQGSSIQAALAEAASIVPVLAPIGPIVQKQFAGEQISAADELQLSEVSAALDELVQAKQTSLSGTSTAQT